MSSPASIRKHPIHPMLIVFPIGLWVSSLVCDVAYYGGSHNEFWKGAAFYAMAGGIVGALLAAVPGLIDYLAITDRRAKPIATAHMVLNFIIVVIFVFDLGIRYNAAPGRDVLSVILSIIGVGLLSASGWLGGSLVYTHRVAVAPTPKIVAPAQKEIEIEIERRAA